MSEHSQPDPNDEADQSRQDHESSSKNRSSRAANLASNRAAEDCRAKALFASVIALVVGVVLRASGHSDLLLIGGLSVVAGCVAWTICSGLWGIVASYGRRGIILTSTAIIGITALIVFNMQTMAYLDTIDNFKKGPTGSYEAREQVEKYVEANRWSPYCARLDDDAWKQVKQAKYAPEFLSWYNKTFTTEGKHQADLNKLRDAIFSNIRAHANAPDIDECRWFLTTFTPDYSFDEDSDTSKVATILVKSFEGKPRSERLLLPPPAVMLRLLQRGGKPWYYCPKDPELNDVLDAGTKDLWRELNFERQESPDYAALRYDLSWDAPNHQGPFKITATVFETPDHTKPAWTNTVAFDTAKQLADEAPFSYWHGEPMSYTPPAD